MSAIIVDSITSQSLQPKDTDAPFTFIEWLKRLQIDYKNVNTTLAYYKQYVIEWNKQVKVQEDDLGYKAIEDQYRQIIADLTLNYTSKEERRFLSALDTTDVHDLDIALGFFATRMKDLCIYFQQKREAVKQKIQRYKTQNSKPVIERLLYNRVLDYIVTDTSENSVYTFSNPLSTYINLFEIEVEELYDIFDKYYDPNDITRQDFDDINSLSLRSTLLVDFDQAIKDEIKKYPFILNSLSDRYAINPAINVENADLFDSYSIVDNDISFLRPKDFIDLIITGDTDDLAINFKRKLIEKNTGTGFTYLSSGSTITEILSGNIFTNENTVLQHNTNRVNIPTDTPHVYVTKRNIGTLNVPDRNTTTYVSLKNYRIHIDIDSIEPNTIYVYSGPGHIVQNIPLFTYNTVTKRINSLRTQDTLYTDPVIQRETRPVIISTDEDGNEIYLRLIMYKDTEVVRDSESYGRGYPVVFIRNPIQYQSFLKSPVKFMSMPSYTDTYINGYYTRIDNTIPQNVTLDDISMTNNVGILTRTRADINNNKCFIYKHFTGDTYPFV